MRSHTVTVDGKTFRAARLRRVGSGKLRFSSMPIKDGTVVLCAHVINDVACLIVDTDKVVPLHASELSGSFEFVEEVNLGDSLDSMRNAKEVVVGKRIVPKVDTVVRRTGLPFMPASQECVPSGMDVEIKHSTLDTVVFRSGKYPKLILPKRYLTDAYFNVVTV